MISPGAAVAAALFTIIRFGLPLSASGLKIWSVPSEGVPERCKERPTFKWLPAASLARNSTKPDVVLVRSIVKKYDQVPLVIGAERVGPAVMTTFVEGVKPVRFWMPGLVPFIWSKSTRITWPNAGPPLTKTRTGI